MFYEGLSKPFFNIFKRLLVVIGSSNVAKVGTVVLLYFCDKPKLSEKPRAHTHMSSVSAFSDRFPNSCGMHVHRDQPHEGPKRLSRLR
jgi:hypothetical protein